MWSNQRIGQSAVHVILSLGILYNSNEQYAQIITYMIAEGDNVACCFGSNVESIQMIFFGAYTLENDKICGMKKYDEWSCELTKQLLRWVTLYSVFSWSKLSAIAVYEH